MARTCARSHNLSQATLSVVPERDRTLKLPIERPRRRAVESLKKKSKRRCGWADTPDRYLLTILRARGTRPGLFGLGLAGSAKTKRRQRSPQTKKRWPGTDATRASWDPSPSSMSLRPPPTRRPTARRRGLPAAAARRRGTRAMRAERRRRRPPPPLLLPAVPLPRLRRTFGTAGTRGS